MSIFFGGSPPITMKRTETSRTCFCLLENIRNRGRSQNKMGAPAAGFASEGLNSVKKGRHVLSRCHIVSAALSGWLDCRSASWGRAFRRCPIGRCIRIICIQIQIYCIVFIFAYNTRYALIRMKYKYLRCIQLYSRIYLQ